MKNKKLLYIGGGIVLLLIILAVVVKSGNSDATKVTVEPVQTATITETVTANGKIQPAQDVKISSDVAGEVTELLVKEGQTVKAGDLLCKIKPDIYQAALNRADAALSSTQAQAASSSARLNQARAQFANAEKVFNRQKELFRQKAISQADYDQATQQYEVAKAEVVAAEQSARSSEFAIRSSQASKKEASDNLQKTMIFAPKSGVVSGLQIEQGERVAGNSFNVGTEMMRISDMNSMEVHVDVNENDIIRVKLGDTALVEVDSYLNRKFKGIVTEIGNAANTTIAAASTDQVINFKVKISILKESYEDLVVGKPIGYSPLRSGMSASVEIQTKTVKNVMAIPIEAVTTRTDSSESKTKYGKKAKKKDKEEEEETEFECVFVFQDEKACIRMVKTGIQDNKNIQVLSGLKQGDEVITGPYSAVSKKLKNKARVQKVDKDELFERSEDSGDNEGGEE